MRPNSVVHSTIVSSSKPRLFQVLQQRRRADRHAAGQRSVITLDVFVAVPIAARKTVVVARPNLHEPHATFQQPSGDQAFAAKVFRFLGRVDLVGILGTRFRPAHTSS